MSLHWTRSALIVGAAVVIASTFLPWLVGVPPGLLHLGSGTIRGITTLHGMLVCLAMAGVLAIALWPPRTVRPHRAALAAAIGAAVIAVAISSLVLGTTASEVFEEIEKVAPDHDAANRAIVAIAPQLKELAMGSGGIVILLGAGLLAAAAIAAMFVKRRR